MAKTREQQAVGFNPQFPIQQEQPAAQAPAPCRYRVELNCPTPLAHPILEVEAADEAGAKLAFCEANGICDSTHPWKVTRVA